MRVLVLAPAGRDADLLCALLRKRSLECVKAKDAHELIAFLKEGGGTVLITEEVIQDVGAFRLIVAQISREPEWSDLPVIALVSARTALALLSPLEQELEPINLSLIERPARSETILRAVKSGLRARKRQYQVRDFHADRLRIQENLWRNQKLESVGLLAGGIAHDFNNLLTGIIGNASLLECTLPEDSKEASYAAEILVAAERSADLTRQMLAYSGKDTFITEPISIPLLIKETAQLIRASLPANVALCFDLDEPSALAVGDKTQLQQVVMNLILNAGEAIPDGQAGTITVAIHLLPVNADESQRLVSDQPLAPGTYIELTVSDNGAGMAPETMSRVFEPFFTTKFLGRGLGLAAVSGIVNRHKGSIHIESRLGEGTTFTVLLPRSESMNQEPGFETSPVPGSSHILVIDDESSVRSLAKAILMKLGHLVSLAENGQEALGILAKTSHEHPIQLVILDWMMPAMDGKTVLAHLRRDYPEISILVSSGYSEGQARASSISSQGLWFLQKPFTANALSMTVAQALRRRNGAVDVVSAGS